MSKYNGKHDKLYPCGNGDVICESQGHQWQISHVCFEILKGLGKYFDKFYRECDRCKRLERQDYIGGNPIWVLNDMDIKSI